MKTTFFLLIFTFFISLTVSADTEGPLLEAADAAYVNSNHALKSTSVEDNQAFSRRAMAAAQDLQAQAMQNGDDTLVNLAQGAYTNAKRASMSSSIEQAHDYNVSAVSFSQQARSMLSQDQFREQQTFTNPNNDQVDTARDVYEASRQDPAAYAY